MPVPTPEQFQTYESAPTRIEQAINGLSDEQLLRRPIAEEWSIHEVLLHLPDSEAFGYERLRRVIAEEQPILQAYPESTWAQQLNYQQQDYRLALALFAAQRRASAALLRALPATAWERTGNHTERGKLTLHELFMSYVGHAEAHLRQIQQLKETS